MRSTRNEEQSKPSGRETRPREDGFTPEYYETRGRFIRKWEGEYNDGTITAQEFNYKLQTVNQYIAREWEARGIKPGPKEVGNE